MIWILGRILSSSYVEGKKNEFAEYGHNRDKKTGKKQIVIGLMTDQDGCPVSTVMSFASLMTELAGLCRLVVLPKTTPCRAVNLSPKKNRITGEYRTLGKPKRG